MQLTAAVMPTRSTTAANRASLAFTSTTTTLPCQQAKLLNLSHTELADIIASDVQERQCLYTAQYTPAIYDDDCQFKDGSNLDGTYPAEAWQRGCQFLFDSAASHCQLVPHTLRVTDRTVKFRFAETLTFNMPPIGGRQPRVSITGTVVLQRHPVTGLIVSYEECWDQDVAEILRRTTFLG